MDESKDQGATNGKELSMAQTSCGKFATGGVSAAGAGIELKQTQRQLEQSLPLLRATLESTADGIFVVDRDGRITSCNRKFAAMWRIPDPVLQTGDDNQVLALVLDQLLDPGAFLAGVREIYNQPEAESFDIIEFKDGRTFERYSQPQRIGDRIAGRVWSFRDVTERKMAEQALRASEERYRNLFSSLHEGFCLLEILHDDAGNPVDYRYQEVNAAYEKSIGMSRDMLIGKTVREVFPLIEESWLEFYASVALTGNPARMENYAGRYDRFVEVHAYSPARGRQIAAVIADVTERRNMEKAQRLESLGVLAGGIAHDFNNILTAIIGNISLARLQVGEEHKAAVRLAACENALTRATNLTQQLLTFARGGAPVKAAVDMERLILEVVSFSFHGSDCKGELDLAEDLWHVDADSGQLHQALNNLIINAVQASPPGGVITIKAANETVHTGDPASLPPGRYVKVTIFDRGRGIPPDILPKIFDPYFTTKSTGSGLGLASVYSIVKRHGGDISVSSEPGNGTSFHVLLPATLTPAGEEPAEQREVEETATDGAILIMDDEELIRSVAAEMLEALGYKVITCADGAEAVRLYRAYRENGAPFAGVILDMTVPGGMGGKEAAAKIRDLDPDANLIISSGYSGDPLFDERNDGPFSGRVAKPYNLQQLATELSRVLNRG